MNLRAMAELDLGRSLEGPDWSFPVKLTGPDGVTEAVRGQVLYDLVRMNPDNGERVVVEQCTITLRRSSLRRVPSPGENWLYEIPESPADPEGSTVQVVSSGTRPPEGGRSLGFIRIYAQQVEQEV